MDKEKPQTNAETDTASEAERKLAEVLQTPITKEEAEKALADLDVDRAKLSIIRQKWAGQAAQLQLQLSVLDQQLLALDLDRAVIFRRLLVNTAPEGKDPDGPAGA